MALQTIPSPRIGLNLSGSHRQEEMTLPMAVHPAQPHISCSFGQHGKTRNLSPHSLRDSRVAQSAASVRHAFFAGSESHGSCATPLMWRRPGDAAQRSHCRWRELRALPENGEFGGVGDMGEPFYENDDNYVAAVVVEAVEARSGLDGFMIKMTDGRYVKCAHNNPEGRLPEYPPQPVIVLKIDDGSNLLMPIIVVDLPAVMLLEAVRNVPMQRPTVYQVVRDMVEMMGYEVKLVRVTHRVQEAYFARIYLTKAGGDENEPIISLDLRPSDAINLAARCKVPIQVNKMLARSDSVRVLRDPAMPFTRSLRGGPIMSPELDRPRTGEDDVAAGEFVLVRSMMMAVVEERYKDAAKLRDELNKLRASKKTSEQKQGQA
eukprot:TRINITY_DN5388_c0_g1_i1.p1 TRINITY_DN5388_c0_g1~~TRINITY_DN5388_c0_g1_i1.p1  ORF type:complete len:376 (-),score=87.74 TRINITY_DN5388_c0_g1_i1:862-1989(-)